MRRIDTELRLRQSNVPNPLRHLRGAGELWHMARVFREPRLPSVRAVTCARVFLPDVDHVEPVLGSYEDEASVRVGCGAGIRVLGL